MRVRDWNDILQTVIDSEAEPSSWRAVGGDRRQGLGEDLYLAHQDVGAFQLKTYAKNPFQVEGVGSKIARRVDDEIDPLFPGETDSTGFFGVQKAFESEGQASQRMKQLETVIETHARAPTTPKALLSDVMDTLESPAYGPMEFDQYDRPERLDELSSTFDEAEELLDTEFEDIIDEDVERGVY